VTDSRTLIRSYRESEWRSARLKAIRSLGQFKDGRSFQFLVDIIENNQDLAEQELALFSLSQRKNRAASLFIKKYREECADTLKPTVAYAIGQAQIYDLGEALLEDLKTALAKQDHLWLKNLVLALGELKEFRATPVLHQLLTNQLKAETDIVLAAFLSLGRLERNPENMQAYAHRMAEESLLNQVFQSAVSQVQIRSQFKIEDYLSKIFEAENPHPALPLELKAYDEEEVKVGLSLFSVEKYWERYLFAYRGLSQKLRSELLESVFKAAPSATAFLNVATQALAGLENPGLLKKVEVLCGNELKDENLRLAFCEVFAEEVDFTNQATHFFKNEVSVELQVRFLNLWHEIALSRPKNTIKKEFASFSQNDQLKPEAYARIIRAAAEQGMDIPEISNSLTKKFANGDLRSSLLLYAERFASPKLIDVIQALPKFEIETLGARILPYLESLAEQKRLDSQRKFLLETLKLFDANFNVDLIVGVLRVIRFTALAEYEKFTVEKSKHQNPLVELNAVIALKAYPQSRLASEALIEKLQSQTVAVRGRALDSLCAHTTLLARRAVIQYLGNTLLDEEVVDKIYRSFDPEQKGGEEFAVSIDAMLKANPDHPQWEKLVRLRDRVATGVSSVIENSPEVVALDARLKILIPKFEGLDATTKFALRAAEQPFVQTTSGVQQAIDKAPSVLEYCKALDLILEKTLGQKHLFPKLDRELHDFQTLWHRVGFGEDYPQLEKVLNLLGLKGKISPEHFPLHKAKMMCGTFFNGKIVQDRFKIFDGLRAWAVIFLIFSRKIPLATGAVGPILKLQGTTDDQAISMAKKLMVLQDLRNPAAHRQTYTDLAMVENVRAEAVALINTLLG
jgi:HEAT repeat protein